MFTREACTKALTRQSPFAVDPGHKDKDTNHLKHTWKALVLAATRLLTMLALTAVFPAGLTATAALGAITTDEAAMVEAIVLFDSKKLEKDQKFE